MAKSAIAVAKRRARKIFASLEESDEALEINGSAEIDIEAAEGEDKTPKFSMVAYTGGAMRPSGWFAEHPIIVDIAGMEVVNGGQIPIHRDHDRGRIVGHATSIRKGGTLSISGVISAENEHAREVVASSRKKFPWQSSIGARLLKAPSFVAEGDRVRVNGRMVNGPVFVARRSRLFEASFVSVGADSKTSAVAAKRDFPMNKKFKAWLEARGFDPESLDDGQLSALKELYEDSLTASQGNDTDQDPDSDGQQIDAARGDQDGTGESQDNGTAQQAVNAQRAGDDGASLDDDYLARRRQTIAAEVRREALVNEHLREYPEVAAQAISEGWGEDRIQLEAYRQGGARAPAVHVEPQLRDNPQAIECAMYMGAGIGNIDAAQREYGERTVRVARNKCMNSPGLQYLFHEFLRAHGNYEHLSSFGDSTIQAALRIDRNISQSIHASQGFSTIGLSGTLSNLANKALLRAFLEVPSVFRRFCRTTGHSDFKTHTKYRVTTMGRLDELPPAGEIKHTEMGEETYENIVKTYARMIALTRTMIRNDDLDAFLQLPAGLGRISAETLEHSVFELLTDNSSGFHSDTTQPIPGYPGKIYQPNALSAGASSALSQTSLGDAEVLFWDQTDMDGKPISLRPSILLVGHKLRRDAINLVNKSTVTVAGDPTSGEQLRVGSEFTGEFEPVASPYINNGTAGASDTQWWLMAAPTADVAAYEVAFLDNRQTPIIESADTDFNTLGMQWRSYFDWGVAEQERRALVYSPGA